MASRETSAGAAAETVAAWATGAGVGLVVLMVTWLVLNRLTALVWEAPLGPTVAFATAIAAGVIATALAGKRLVSSLAN